MSVNQQICHKLVEIVARVEKVNPQQVVWRQSQTFELCIHKKSRNQVCFNRNNRNVKYRYNDEN